MGNTEIGKPPVGLRPIALVSRARAVEILEAALRYVTDGVRVPDEWLDEFKMLNRSFDKPPVSAEVFSKLKRCAKCARWVESAHDVGLVEPGAVCHDCYEQWFNLARKYIVWLPSKRAAGYREGAIVRAYRFIPNQRDGHVRIDKIVQNLRGDFTFHLYLFPKPTP